MTFCRRTSKENSSNVMDRIAHTTHCYVVMSEFMSDNLLLCHRTIHNSYAVTRQLTKATIMSYKPLLNHRIAYKSYSYITGQLKKATVMSMVKIYHRCWTTLQFAFWIVRLNRKFKIKLVWPIQSVDEASPSRTIVPHIFSFLKWWIFLSLLFSSFCEIWFLKLLIINFTYNNGPTPNQLESNKLKSKNVDSR